MIRKSLVSWTKTYYSHPDRLRILAVEARGEAKRTWLVLGESFLWEVEGLGCHKWKDVDSWWDILSSRNADGMQIICSTALYARPRTGSFVLLPEERFEMIVVSERSMKSCSIAYLS